MTDVTIGDETKTGDFLEQLQTHIQRPLSEPLQFYALFLHATRPDKPGAIWTLISAHRTKEGAEAAAKLMETEGGGWLIDGPIELKE